MERREEELSDMRCEVESKTSNGMDGQFVETMKCERDGCGARKYSCT